jgi:hypothetical protein
MPTTNKSIQSSAFNISEDIGIENQSSEIRIACYSRQQQ